MIYDENGWAPAPLHIDYGSRQVILDDSNDQSSNTVSLIDGQFGTLDLLVVPPYTEPTRAYTAVMTAASPDNVSTADELLGIGPRAAQDRRHAVMARLRWECEGGAFTPTLQPGRRRWSRAGEGVAPCSVSTSAKRYKTSSAGFHGTAQNWSVCSTAWSRLRKDM